MFLSQIFGKSNINAKAKTYIGGWKGLSFVKTVGY